MGKEPFEHKKGIFSSVLSAFLFLIIYLHPSVCVGAKLPVVTSIYPVADMVQQIGGKHIEVTFILPAGASPHTFEPKPSLVKKISSAKIFFMIGAGLEIWAQKFVKLAGPELKTIVLSQGVALIHTTGYHDKPDLKHGASEAGNPHIWLDPVIAKTMVKKIGVALASVDPGNVTYYRQQGRKYLDELDRLHNLIKATAETFKIQKFISFHASWDYFAKRYGLESVGVIEAAPGRNPTPIQIKNIVVLIKKHGIRAVFAEPQLNPRAAKVIAKETGIKVLMLDPVGSPYLKGRSTYIDLMKHNLKVLQEALK